jgi:heme oxygenase
MADQMRQRTQALHTQAEQSGIVRAILSGRVDRAGYVLFLRNLWPVYQQLELGLARHQGQPGIGDLHRPELSRTQALAADLRALAGPDFAQALPLLPAGQHYADRVATAAAGDGRLLIAHAYTRYLGDLAGGRVLARRLRAAGLGEEDGCGLAFYAFPQIAQVSDFARTFRTALDRAAATFGNPADVLEEAALAFQLNIALSLAVESAR